MQAVKSPDIIIANPSRNQSNIVVRHLSYLFAGMLFGFIAVKSEIISWYRIQEMFRFQAFHMYGIIATAVLVSAISIWLIKRTHAKAFNGEEIRLSPKAPTYFRYIVGGSIFGLGWALTGACPGPIYALIGTGMFSFIVIFLGAVLGTWFYGILSDKLPH
ncbi:MAG: DUF6691 family protein [Deinococcales bacterium]